MRREFAAGADDGDRRLETVVRRLCPQLSLGTLHKALRQGDIRLNGAKALPESRVAAGDTIAIWEKLLSEAPPRATFRATVPPVPPEWVLYEGTDLVVINKPSGILVHSAEGARSEAPLDERVRAWLSASASASLGFRPGPLHRLDRETSGLVVFSRTLAGARQFSDALASRQVKKTYLAVLTGSLEGSQEVRNRLQRNDTTRTTAVDDSGDEAVSVFHPLARSGRLTLAEVDLGTGRTHQIRVHAQSLGHPLAGDGKYAGGPTPVGLQVPWLLHAWKLVAPGLPLLSAPLAPGVDSWVKKTFKIPV